MSDEGLARIEEQVKSIDHRLDVLENHVSESAKMLQQLQINGAVSGAALPVWKWMAVFCAGALMQLGLSYLKRGG